MDLQQEYFKKFQYRINTYCITKKPYLSLDFGITRLINSSYFQFNNNLSKSLKKDQWIEKSCATTSSNKYPSTSIYFYPFNFFSFHLSSGQYQVILNPNQYSLFLNFIQDTTIKYGISYVLKPEPSIIGSFNINDILCLSTNFCDDQFSMFFKINVDNEPTFFGLKLKNNGTFWKSVNEFHAGITLSVFNSLYLFGFGFCEPSGFSITRITKNHRFTYINKSSILGGIGIHNDYYLQYKYISDGGSKIGALYDCTENTIYTRCCLKASENLELKASIKYNGKWYEPTFGLGIYFE